ncbi:hypothetical protein [Paraflavitalea pollutisoli]|uniref:hypothetical protein n=1 Tax=Paraflavitalea pollutisoli TaxID=3034143 RepID=UPI0023ECE4FC|nr:hypothetical protein [Paraflavitalea sp. H1-2-19X]
MKSFFSLLLAAGLCQVAQAQTETPFQTKSLKDAGIEKVTAETSGGNISVTGGAADLRIDVYIRPSNGRISTLSKEDIQKRLEEDYDFKVTTENHQLTAIARPKDRSGSYDWKRALSISFVIYVPRNVATSLTTSGGNVALAHLAGVQDFRTSGGNLSLDDLTGNIKGSTSGGNIDIKDSKDDITLITSGGNVKAANCDGKIRLTTSGGNVTLDQLKGTIDATTSGGTVRATTVGGDLSAVTSGGNVHLENLSCSVRASTSGGNMTVSLKELGSFVKLANSGGNISLDLPGGKGLDLHITGGKVKAGTLSNFSGTVEDDSIDGKINGGGIPVTVKGGSGRVTLSIK